MARRHPPPHCENTRVLREAITEDEPEPHAYIPIRPNKIICEFTVSSPKYKGMLVGFDIYILFVVTAAGVVLCGSPKKQPRTSSMVQFIFFFWSFEISGNILRNQKISYV